MTWMDRMTLISRWLSECSTRCSTACLVSGCGTVALALKVMRGCIVGDCRSWQTYKRPAGGGFRGNKMREIIVISQSAIAVGALSVWIACALPDCLEAFDACCDLYNLYPSSSTIPRPSRNPRRGPTRAVVAAAVFLSSLRIFGPYLSLLALVLFLLCYFSGSASVVSSVPRTRPRFRMLLSHSSRKQLLLKGSGASSALLRSVKSHGNGFKRGFRKAAYYSTSARPDNQTGGAGLGAGKPEWGRGLPLYRQSCSFPMVHSVLTCPLHRKNYHYVDGDTDEMVSAASGGWSAVAGCPPIPEKSEAGPERGSSG